MLLVGSGERDMVTSVQVTRDGPFKPARRTGDVQAGSQVHHFGSREMAATKMTLTWMEMNLEGGRLWKSWNCWGDNKSGTKENHCLLVSEYVTLYPPITGWGQSHTMRAEQTFILCKLFLYASAYYCPDHIQYLRFSADKWERKKKTGTYEVITFWW